MPYANEHSARIKTPDDFKKESFRRKNIAPGVDIIIGKLEGQSKTTAQAYRFDKKKFNPAEAKKWLKDNKVKYISFEAAKKTDFKGFDDWIPIFAGGKQIDSKGIEHDGDALIDKALATFDANYHEPPICVGHPKENTPAFGWIAELKKIGTMLYARAKDVVPEFAKAVQQGLYKKRSASFYPDGRLRHVGFLGAAPPAVKGLEDLKFQARDDAITFDFYDPDMNTIARIFRGLRDWLIEKEGKEKADQIIPDWDVDYIKDQASKDEITTGQATAFGGAANSIIDDRSRVGKSAERRAQSAERNKEGKTMSGFKERFKNFLGFMGVDMSKVPDDALPEDAPEGAAATSFSEADIEAAKKEAAETEREKVEAEFAEKDRKAARKAREGEVSAWCDQMVEKGRLTPALVKYGVKEILSFLARSDDVIEFGEGDGKEKVTAFDRLKGMFEAELPKLVNFGEIAKRDEHQAGEGGAADKLDALVKKKMAENKDLDYRTAFSEVQVEHPDLLLEYQNESREAA